MKVVLVVLEWEKLMILSLNFAFFTDIKKLSTGLETAYFYN